jgi:hypothetical protein
MLYHQNVSTKVEVQANFVIGTGTMTTRDTYRQVLANVSRPLSAPTSKMRASSPRVAMGPISDL